MVRLVIVPVSVGLAKEQSLPYRNDYLRVIIDDTLSEFGEEEKSLVILGPTQTDIETETDTNIDPDTETETDINTDTETEQ